MDGLGDVVKKVTELTGISYVTNLIVNGDSQVPCSKCEQRRKEMNEMFPFNNKK